MEYIILLFELALVVFVVWQGHLNHLNISLVFDETEPSELELAAREYYRLELALAATNNAEDQRVAFKAFTKAHFQMLALVTGESTEKVKQQKPEPDIRRFRFSILDFAADDPSVILPGDDVSGIEDNDEDEPVLH